MLILSSIFVDLVMTDDDGGLAEDSDWAAMIDVGGLVATVLGGGIGMTVMVTWER